MTTPAAPLASQPDPMLSAFTARAQQTAPPASTAGPSASGDPMLDAFTARKMQAAQPQAAAPQQTEQPGFGQRTYEASGLKGIIDTAKQKWQESQASAQEEQKMAESAMEALKSKNYGQAAELILGHLAKHIGKEALGPGAGMIGDMASAAKSSVEGRAKHAIKGVQEAKAGHLGTAALEGAGALGADERMIEDIENKNLPGLAGDVAGGGIKAGAMLAGAKFGGETAAGEEAAPGLVKQVLKGEKVAQGPAASAIRGTVGAEEDATLLEGNKTVVDEHLKSIAQKEKAAYQKMDEAAGFDVKAERETLKNDEYKLKQLGNTEADQTAREKLTTAIEDSKGRISEAEKKMSAAGVDVKEADVLHKQRMAGQEFKKALVQHVSQDGETVNVDGLLNASKKLRFSKYGDRLEQFMGSKEKADEFMHKLEAAQDLGEKAVKRQQLAKWIGGIAGVGAAGEAIHMAKEVLQ